ARQEEIFWRIKRQYRRKRVFILHSLIYAIAWLWSTFVIATAYHNWQQANLPSYQTMYRRIFDNTLYEAGIIMGIWTVVLIFHFVFNRMGDAEDKALGEALA